MFQRAIMEVCEQICPGTFLVGRLCACLVWTKAYQCPLSCKHTKTCTPEKIAAIKLDPDKDAK